MEPEEIANVACSCLGGELLRHRHGPQSSTVYDVW